jgi:3-vinyl bacteriochlorophyllide hydratase
MTSYTPEQLRRRDASRWTTVQAILAPVQFLVFLVSFALVVRTLLTGEGYALATASVLLKIALLWAITITGMFWEHEIYGHYFMAREFFWEDLGNAVAMITHNLYFVAQALHWPEHALLQLMLVAYVTYLVNCAQFVRRGIAAARQRRGATA